MKEVLENILEQHPTEKFLALSLFYREKNKRGFGLFSTLAGETFPDRWIEAINSGVWKEDGVYGDNFRKAFNLK